MSIAMTHCKPQPLNLKNYPMPVTLDSIAEQLHDIRRLLAAQARKRNPTRPAKRRSPRIRRLSDEQKDTVDCFLRNGRNTTAAAMNAGVSRQAFQGRLNRAISTLEAAGMADVVKTLQPFREPARPQQQYPHDLRGAVAI